MNQNTSEPQEPRMPRPEPGGVPPGETPPAEDTLSGAGPRETYNPPRGWGIAPVIVILVVVALFAVFLLVGWFTR